MNQEIEQVTAIYNTIVEFLVNYSFQIVGAIIILLIGIFIAKKVSNVALKKCLSKGIDQTLSGFIASFVRITIIVMIAIMALNKIGISVTPLLATVGALSLGAGLAIQGLVSNYGAGLNIIITRRFVVGDTIEVNGVKGIVNEVNLGFTLLKNEDDVEIMVPNRHIVGEVIKNSHKEMLVSTAIGVAYGQSPQQAIDIITNVLDNSPLVDKKRKANVGVEDFGQSAIQIGIRFWVASQTYFADQYQVNQAIYEALLEANVTIPFPKRDVQLVDQRT